MPLIVPSASAVASIVAPTSGPGAWALQDWAKSDVVANVNASLKVMFERPLAGAD
jgi:hypothetical protein